MVPAGRRRELSRRREAYTRVTEYKHLTGQEHPQDQHHLRVSVAPRAIPTTPCRGPRTQALYKRTRRWPRATPDVWFVGRLATYRYYNMDQVVGQALATFRRIDAALPVEADTSSVRAMPGRSAGVLNCLTIITPRHPRAREARPKRCRGVSALPDPLPLRSGVLGSARSAAQRMTGGNRRRTTRWKCDVSGGRSSGCRPSASAATCSAGRSTSRRRSGCSTPSSTAASTSSTPPTSTRGGPPATRAASPRRSSASGCKQSGKRDRVVIATKVGMEMGPGEKGLSGAYILRGGGGVAEAPPDRPHRPVPVAHQDDPETPLEETLGAFGDLIRQGKVRAIGASNYSAARLAEALRTVSATACRATSASSRTTTSASAPGSRAGWSRSAARRGSASSPTTRWPRVPDREVPLGGGPGQERPRQAGQEIPERARLPHPRGPRRGRRRATAPRRPGWRSRGCWPGRG